MPGCGQPSEPSFHVTRHADCSLTTSLGRPLRTAASARTLSSRSPGGSAGSPIGSGAVTRGGKVRVMGRTSSGWALAVSLSAVAAAEHPARFAPRSKTHRLAPVLTSRPRRAYWISIGVALLVGPVFIMGLGYYRGNCLRAPDAFVGGSDRSARAFSPGSRSQLFLIGYSMMARMLHRDAGNAPMIRCKDD